MCKLVTADLGSFNIKIATGEGSFIFENRFTVDNEAELFGAEYITFQENTYVFNKGSFDKELCKTKKNFEISLLYALAKAGVKGDINLILHLPESSIVGQKQVLIDRLQGKDFEYVCNGENNNIRVKKLGVLKEGFSSFYALKKRNNGMIGIIDIGGRSTEVFTFINGQLEKETSIPVGTMDLFKKIVDVLTNNGENRKLEDIKKLLDNNIIDISEYEEIIDKMCKDLTNSIKLEIPSLEDYNIHLTGGGAGYFVSFLKKYYNKLNEMQDSLFSNVIGAYNIGKAKKW